MSWNPFKKAFSGRRTRTEDVDFEREINKLRHVQVHDGEQAVLLSSHYFAIGLASMCKLQDRNIIKMRAVIKRLYKDMRKCNEIETGYSRSLQHILIDMKTSSSARQDPIRALVEVFAAVMDAIHVHSRNLRTNQDVMFVEPMKKLNDVCKKVEVYSKQREQKLQEYERQQSRLDKQGRKASAHTQVASQSSRMEMNQVTGLLARTRADYERVHDRLMLEVPQLVDVKGNYLDVCLLASVRAQAIYYKECTETLAEVARGLDIRDDAPLQDTRVPSQDGNVQDSSTPPWYMKEHDMQERTAQHLASVRMLSIVGTTLIN